LKTEKIFWFFSSTRELERVFGCVIWEKALLWVLLGLITMIEVDNLLFQRISVSPVGIRPLQNFQRQWKNL